LDLLRYGGCPSSKKMINKAVILARGLGTRMRAENKEANLDSKQSEIADLGIKALMPIYGGKTLLDLILNNLSDAGFTKHCIVIGNEHQAIRDYCKKLNYNISFAIQEKPLGTANAVLAAEQFVNGDNFLMINSDNLYPVNDLRALRNLNKVGFIAYDKNGLIEKSNINETKINKFAILEIDENDELLRIVEKPETSQNHSFISMNAWILSPLIFDAAKQIEPSARQEYELADAVNLAIKKFGEKFQAVYSNEGVLDLSSRADIVKLAERLKKDV
jgi:dTDP-glucose pyrophosphorylase